MTEIKSMLPEIHTSSGSKYESSQNSVNGKKTEYNCYNAPELAQKGAKDDLNNFSLDIWSIGCIFAQLMFVQGGKLEYDEKSEVVYKGKGKTIEV